MYSERGRYVYIIYGDKHTSAHEAIQFSPPNLSEGGSLHSPITNTNFRPDLRLDGTLANTQVNSDACQEFDHAKQAKLNNYNGLQQGSLQFYLVFYCCHISLICH